MKVLIVVPGGVHPSGEVEVIPVLLDLCRALSQQHQICIVALHQHQQLTEYQLLDCRVISLPNVKTSALPSACLTTIRRLKHFGFMPDVVHSFWLGKPTLLGAMLSKKYNVPLLASVAGGESVNIPEIGYGGSRTFISRWLNGLSLKWADASSCGSRFVQSAVEQRWGVMPQLIPLGIDIEFWQLKDAMQNVGKPWQLVQIASINRVKDSYLLLRVANDLKKAGFDFHLNWIGEDTLDGVIEQQAAKMGLSELISFHGFKTQKQLKPMLMDQHFVIQTSVYESQGVAMAEACSQGVCPVGTDVGWLSDLGVGVRADEIAGQIMMLAEDFEARRDRVDKGQQWIVANDVLNTARLFDACYAEVLGTCRFR